MTPSRRLRLVYPHQLFAEQLEAAPGTRFVLVEDDLFLRQLPFHAQKLVLHRASMRHFAARLREAGFEVEVIETSPTESSGSRLAALVEGLRPDEVTAYDVVDDWLGRDCRRALADGGYRLRADDVLESPGFLTGRRELAEWFGGHRARMSSFYSWQRRRLGLLVDDAGEPEGGRWSFDTENRKRLPKGYAVPARAEVPPDAVVTDALDWVESAFPDAPGDPRGFSWPVTPDAARTALTEFVDHRLHDFGPYEDAISAEHPFLFHSALTPALNCGLLGPREIVTAVMAAAARDDVPLASLEGFLRQVIGWREYMRATYHLHGRRMRTGNALRHARPLAAGWWDGTTGLEPVDLVIRRVLQRGWAHHIERLMVLGNAMALLRTDPTEVYEWFMALFVDAYDWVMVPNVYAMSQFAAGAAITTKPYVSGSAYLRRMSDVPAGEWTDDWDGLYWAFVTDHREVFEANPRARMAVRSLDNLDPERREAVLSRGRAVLGRL